MWCLTMNSTVSVIVPSKNCTYLNYLLIGLREQTIMPNELVLVLKQCNIKQVERFCNQYNLPCVIIEQRKGYFTHALNIGKKEAKGDIIIFTDDDAIPPKKWIQRYLALHRKYPRVAGICSRDIYIDITTMKLLPTPDDILTIRLYRWFIRLWLEQPHPLLKKYQLGVYLTKKLDIAHGPYIPVKTCYSLAFRGVNMSFKHEFIYDVWFPEHPRLKRAPGNEQYFSLQIVLKGYDIIYTPSNPVLHIMRMESLSRASNAVGKSELLYEYLIMKNLFKKILYSHGIKSK